jgi:hypothetical protein
MDDHTISRAGAGASSISWRPATARLMDSHTISRVARAGSSIFPSPAGARRKRRYLRGSHIGETLGGGGWKLVQRHWRRETPEGSSPQRQRASGGSLRRLAELVGWSEGVDEECPLHTVQPRRPLYLRMSTPPPSVPIDTMAEVRLSGAVKRAAEDDYLSLEFPKKQRMVDEDDTAEESETEGGETEWEVEESEPEVEESESGVEESESGVEESEPVNAGGGLLSWATSLFTRS